MLIAQSDVFVVSAGAAEVLTIRDVATAVGVDESGRRTLSFTNLSSSELTITIYEYDVDSWDLLTTITLAAFGAAGYVKIYNVTSTNMIQVKASGGGGSVPELQIDYMRNYESNPDTWIAPFI